MIAVNRIRLIDCPPTKRRCSKSGGGVSIFRKNFSLIHLLITTKCYNLIRNFRKEVADFEEFFASVGDGGLFGIDERFHELC